MAASSVGDSEPAATSSCSSESPWWEVSADFVALSVPSCWTSDLKSLESLDGNFKPQAELSWPCFSHGCFTRKLYVRQPLLNKSNWCHELIQIILHTCCFPSDHGSWLCENNLCYEKKNCKAVSFREQTLGFGAIRGSEIGWSGFGGSSLISYTTAEKVHKRMKLQISLVAALMEDN